MAFRRRRPDLEGRYMTATTGAGERGGQAADTYTRYATDFNVDDALSRSRGAALADFRESVGRDIADLRGSAVGAGRIDTGYLTGDEDRLISDYSDRLARAEAANSLQALGLESNVKAGLGGFGQRELDREADLVSGGLDRADYEDELRRRKRKGILSGLGTLAGGVGGFLLGGPAGAAAGASVGGNVFGSF